MSSAEYAVKIVLYRHEELIDEHIISRFVYRERGVQSFVRACHEGLEYVLNSNRVGDLQKEI